MDRSKWVIIRDLAIFQVKLALDGIKDVVLMPLSVVAAGMDLLFPGSTPGRRFYFILRLGERYDGWLNLFGAARDADARRDGLFGASRAGSDSMLGRMESLLTGRDETGTVPRSSHPRA
jgi:hypothetical protein